MREGHLNLISPAEFQRSPPGVAARRLFFLTLLGASGAAAAALEGGAGVEDGSPNHISFLAEGVETVDSPSEDLQRMTGESVTSQTEGHMFRGQQQVIRREGAARSEGAEGELAATLIGQKPS